MVSKRLKQKGVPAIENGHRLESLKLGCESVSGPEGWLQSEPRGAAHGSCGQVIKKLRPEILAEHEGTVIFKVMGADTAERYPGEISGPTVIMSRNGSNLSLRNTIT